MGKPVGKPAKKLWIRLRRMQRHEYPSGMSREPHASPIGEAMAWASRIMAIGLAMFLPAVAGGWLDSRLGTTWLGPVGLALGFTMGLAWLVQIGRKRNP